ncbi:MAG: glycosyltransferase [Vicinamibacterales bacterium]
MSALRVLHVIPAVAARYGGPSVATAGICRALNGLGISTLVATTDADGPGRLDVRCGEVLTWDGVAAIMFPRTHSESFKRSPALARWLHEHVREFDLVHIHAVFSHACLAAARACRAGRIPYLVRPLGTLDPWSLAHHGFRKRLLLAAGARAALQRARGMHYTSTEEMRLAEGALPGLPTGYVVPLGVSDDLFCEPRAVASLSAPYVLSLSRLESKKGVDVLIRAFHKLAEYHRLGPWSLQIAGDGEPGEVDELRALANSGQAQHRITFAGWVSGPARQRMFREASLFALPSHQENFGFALVEAMASGVPVIASPGVNLAGDILAAGAGWVADRETFVDGLGQAMSSQTECRSRGRAARSYADQFRWARVGEQLIEVYNAIRGAVVHQPIRPVAQAGTPVGATR